MGAQRSELADIHALLHTLQHQPFSGEQHTGPTVMGQGRAGGCCAA